jgi:replicative DNA helicase
VLRDLPEVKAELYRWASSDIVRVPIGYSFFDDRTQGGMAPGQVMIMLARTGVGKTWFLVNVAVNQPQIPTVFFSLEMHGRYILERLASVYSDTATTVIETGMRTHGASSAVEAAASGLPLLHIEDEPDLGLGDMTKVLDDYETRVGQRPRLVLIDYLELISTWGESQMDSVQSMARALKNFAREHDVALVVLHQVKRGEANAGHKQLDLTDGKFGGEESADYVLGMYKPSLSPNVTQDIRERMEKDIRFQFLKTRTGGGIHPDGVRHVWNPDTGRISEPILNVA